MSTGRVSGGRVEVEMGIGFSRFDSDLRRAAKMIDDLQKRATINLGVSGRGAGAAGTAMAASYRAAGDALANAINAKARVGASVLADAGRNLKANVVMAEAAVKAAQAKAQAGIAAAKQQAAGIISSAQAVVDQAEAKAKRAAAEVRAADRARMAADAMRSAATTPAAAAAAWAADMAASRRMALAGAAQSRADGGVATAQGAFGVASSRAGSIGQKAAQDARAEMSGALANLEIAKRRLYNSVPDLSKVVWKTFSSIAETGVKVVGQTFNSLRSIQMGVSRFTANAGLSRGMGGLDVATAVRHAADLETMMARLQRVSGASGDKLKGMADEVKALASDMAGVKLEDAFGIATFGAKMGISGDKLGMFTRDVAKFSQAIDDISPEEAATKFARLSTVFGTGIEETRRYAAALVGLDQASTASARDILDITARMAPMAKLLGMKPDRAMALATSAREIGANPEVAGSALAQILGKMADPKNRRQFAKIAGMNDRQFQADPTASFMAVGRGLGAMGKDQGIAALGKMGLEGVRVRQVMLGLAAASGKQAELVNVAAREWKNLTTIQGAAAITGSTLNAQWERLANNFKLTAASIGTAILPAIKGLADGLIRLMGDIRASIDANMDTFRGWGLRLGDTLSNIGALWRSFPLYVEYATITVQEKLGQMAEVFRRFAALAGGYMKHFGEDIQGYIEDILDNLSARMHNVIASFTGGKLMIPQPVVFGRGNLTLDQRAHREAAKSDPTGKERWGMDLVKDLPNMNAQKAAAVAKIGMANMIQQAQHKDRMADNNAKDDEARAKAEFAGGDQNRMVKPAGLRAGEAIGQRDRRLRNTEGNAPRAWNPGTFNPYRKAKPRPVRRAPIVTPQKEPIEDVVAELKVIAKNTAEVAMAAKMAARNGPLAILS